MASPQQFNINDLISQTLGQVQQNNDAIGSLGGGGQRGTGLLGNIQRSQKNSMMKNVLGAILGGGLGAIGAQFDDNVSTGGGALFGALGGGLLSRKLRQTNQQNAFSNIASLQKSSQESSKNLMDQLGARAQGDAINQIRLDRGLSPTASPLYGVSDATAKLATDGMTPEALASVYQLLGISQQGGFDNGLSVANSSNSISSPGGSPIPEGLSQVQAPDGLETDPSVLQDANGNVMLRGGVDQQSTQLDPRTQGAFAGLPPVITTDFMKTLTNAIQQTRDTGLTQGVEGARVPSENRKDDAAAFKSTEEAKVVPQDAQSRRISANASMANAGANNTRANTAASLAPSQIGYNNARAQFYSQPIKVLGSIDSNIKELGDQLTSKQTPRDQIPMIRAQMAALQQAADKLRQEIGSSTGYNVPSGDPINNAAGDFGIPLN